MEMVILEAGIGFAGINVSIDGIADFAFGLKYFEGLVTESILKKRINN